MLKNFDGRDFIVILIYSESKLSKKKKNLRIQKNSSIDPKYYEYECKQAELRRTLLVQAWLVKLLLEPELEPSSRPSPKIVFELDSYINRAEPEPTHKALNKI
jgi:hypothetical protein